MSKLKMVMKNGQKVPFYAADGKGKMEMGGPTGFFRLQDENRRFAMQGKEMGASDKILMAKMGIESYDNGGEEFTKPGMSYSVQSGDSARTNEENKNARDPFKKDVSPEQSQRMDNARITRKRNPLG